MTDEEIAEEVSRAANALRELNPSAFNVIERWTGALIATLEVYKRERDALKIPS